MLDVFTLTPGCGLRWAPGITFDWPTPPGVGQSSNLWLAYTGGGGVGVGQSKVISGAHLTKPQPGVSITLIVWREVALMFTQLYAIIIRNAFSFLFTFQVLWLNLLRKKHSHFLLVRIILGRCPCHSDTGSLLHKFTCWNLLNRILAQKGHDCMYMICILSFVDAVITYFKRRYSVLAQLPVEVLEWDW